ncbi:MAG: right-handed parallel beta-helix repeat-containing protein [Planctomycetes bacterium]|nr:right-handed parallel beta-helix repeat-containing protein [Planctomycetota bacterium]
MRLLMLAAAILLFAPAAPARDIFVNNAAGDDRFDGSQSRSIGGTGPCRTIARALRAAEKGDRVVIADTGVPYMECVALSGGRHSGLADRPFVIEGGGAMLSGLAPVPEAAWEGFRGDVVRFAPPRKGWQQLYRDGAPLLRRDAQDEAPLPDLQPLEWCLWRGAIYFRVEEGALPSQYDLAYAFHPVGLTLYEVRNVVVTNLVIQGYQLDGVSAPDNAFDVTLVGLNCRGNGRSGIAVGGASRVTIDACLVGNNGEAQVLTEGYCDVQITNSDLLDNTAPPLVKRGGDVTVENPAAPP